MPQETDKKEKTMAIIAYMTIVGLIIAFITNREKRVPLTSYHIRQSAGLAVTGLILSVVNIIPILGWIIAILGSFLLLYMWIAGLMNAMNAKQKPIPLLGEKYAKWFKGL
ncbi:DUF4870 domain-containing protein [Sinomicrobium soli]|uniref:DUF4870 domain-containing protein n=1 Tax=Sinomicrobium sp. N-1-3-6 TaxID=2219864 RepID=UPI000DCD0372|nr:hypothetical protein [Sinomicrobium sp. N-1-3-6]RAV29552.1 hypothetical protein DN748_08655 [Sinomicrobium sp. N-1-3-6]